MTGRHGDAARRATLLLSVAAGGALGASGRYALQLLLPPEPAGVPWATLAANVAGCLLMGVLMVVLLEGLAVPHRLLRPFLGVGVLGGFTTFSAFVAEVDALARAGQAAAAGGYLAVTLLGSLLAVHAGIAGTRGLLRARREGTGW